VGNKTWQQSAGNKTAARMNDQKIVYAKSNQGEIEIKAQA
jgi:hypothetical protein